MKRYSVVAVLSLVALSLIGVSSLQATDRMKSGQWEVSITTGGQTATNTDCDMPEQVKGTNGSPEEIRASLEQGAASLHCTLQDFKMEKDTIAYAYACPGRTTERNTSYHGDTYESVVTLKAGGQVHTSQIKGRRLGDCP